MSSEKKEIKKNSNFFAKHENGKRINRLIWPELKHNLIVMIYSFDFFKTTLSGSNQIFVRKWQRREGENVITSSQRGENTVKVDEKPSAVLVFRKRQNSVNSGIPNAQTLCDWIPETVRLKATVLKTYLNGALQHTEKKLRKMLHHRSCSTIAQNAFF